MKTQKGFTLLELVIVIGVMVILATFSFTLVDPITQFQKANDSRRKSDLTEIQKGLEQYYQDTGSYPKSSSNEIVNFSNNTAIAWGSSWAPYMNLLPKDPDRTKTYTYVVRADYQAYWLYANLDRGGRDPQACKFVVSACNKNPNSTSCQCDNVPSNTHCGSQTTYCNFGVSSPNTTP